jgi:hypothetical protein
MTFPGHWFVINLTSQHLSIMFLYTIFINKMLLKHFITKFKNIINKQKIILKHFAINKRLVAHWLNLYDRRGVCSVKYWHVYNFCDKGVNYQIISNLIEHTDRHDQIYVDKRSYVWQVRLLKSEIIVNWDQQYTLNRSLIHSHGFILYNCRSKSLVGVLWAWSTFVNVLWLISVLLKLLI